MFFAAGSQESVPDIGRGEYNLTPEGKKIFLNAVNSLLPAVERDVTVPGDIVKGVPDDGDWPGAETPPLVIDDNTGTKYLHFKGETETTGFKVTPLNGPSIVTGLTFTTANDAAPRDPVAFELYGSNESIDGPYELIASGDIVDFAQADAWPRFTKNETPISFDNGVAYDHYQVLFPAVRDAANANSMQIAEVELIGIPEPIPADVTALGDAIQGVPNDGDWPGAETPDLAIDNNKRTKYLHFKGDFAPDPGTGGTGFQVTPAAGPSIVTGLTLTTANDVPGRDPIAFELSGSNEGIDGPYELIASGEVVDFAQEVEWPRFTMNATPISFDNDVAYAHYQIIFTAIRAPVGGSVNSMQIAEVELLGVRALPAVNILANGGFEEGVAMTLNTWEPLTWNLYGSGSIEVVTELTGAAVPEAPIEGNYCLHIVVPAAGANFWDVGLQHIGHTFQVGKKYTLSAFLKCNQGTLQVNFKPELAEDPWTGFGEQVITMTDQWAEYSVTTPVFEADVSPASITFHIAFAAGDFWMDGVRFVEVE